MEQKRTDDLFSLFPDGCKTILEVGARDGHHTRLLTGHFESVTALDLEKPEFTIARVTPVAGDATALQFADGEFDCVLCAEVMEHIPAVERAAGELRRVARRAVIIGVPFQQDTRSGRTTCKHCGKTNPPYGHVNVFTLERLEALFSPWRAETVRYVGETRDRTNAVSAWLMDQAGNPYGTYDQEEPCVHCGGRLEAPERGGAGNLLACKAAHLLTRAQRSVTQSWANWVHARFMPPAA